MNLSDYQKAAVRTNADLGSRMLNNIHMVLGLTSELVELHEAINERDYVNIVEEITDVNWYLANYCTQEGYLLEELIKEKPTIDVANNYKYNNFTINLINQISELANLHKRELAYKKTYDRDVQKQILINIIHSIYYICNVYILDIEKGMQNNIDKLRKRYPERFEESLALNRDLDAERKELEK